ncbi:MAG: ABC transporter permease, partial [Acidimicrobiia bacterium]
SGSWRHAFLSDLFRKHAVASLERALGGWLIAAVVGVVGGVFLGSWRPARMFFSPIIRFGMSTPSSVMLPVFIALFGITDTMVFALVAMGCTWSILLNTIDGVRTIDSTILMTATSLRLRKRDRLFKVILPGAGPQIMTGLRITLGLSLILVVISELYVSTHGVGYYLGASQRSFKYVPMWSAVFLLALCGLVLNALFALFEGRVLRWHHRSKA